MPKSGLLSEVESVREGEGGIRERETVGRGEKVEQRVDELMSG